MTSKCAVFYKIMYQSVKNESILIFLWTVNVFTQNKLDLGGFYGARFRLLKTQTKLSQKKG